MRSFSSISAGLLAFVLAGEALAASPALFRRTGSFTSNDLSVSAGSSQLTLEKAARQIALAEVPALGAASLGVAQAVVLGSGERVVKLPQVHQGLPVVSRGVAVTFGIDNAARLITSKLEVDLPSSVVPQTSAETAALVASRFTGFTVDASRAALAIWPTADGAKLVWVVAPTAIVGLPSLPVTVVDATTSEVVLAYDAILSLNQAKMYPSNPVKSPATIDVTLPVGVGMSNLSNALVKSYTCVDDHKLKSIPGFPISIHMCSLFQTAAPDMNGDYLLQPAADTEPEDAFAEVSIFYHANRAYDYFRAFDPMLAVDPNILTTVSNLRMPDGLQTQDIGKLTDPNLPLVPFQNAFFAPQDPTFSALFGINGAALWFGQGPLRDYSYDGDVIYHEFTHAVVNVTLKLAATPHLDEYGASESPGGMNEGLSDYFSSALTGDPDVGEYAIGDFGAGMAAIRSLSNPDACPSAVGGEVHQDATLFSGALWDVRKSLNAAQQAEFDQAVFTAMNSSATGDLAYEEFGQLVIDAVTASPLGQGVADQLKSAFTTRGLFPKCTRVLEYKGTPLSGPADLQNAWFSLGTTRTGVKSAEGYTVGVVQVHLPLAANTGKINVEFKGQDIGGAGGLGGGGTAFKPGVLFHFGDEPLMFNYGPLAPKNGATFVAATKSGSSYSATVEVPAGTANAYVMVVNQGQNNGVVTQLALTTEAGAGGTGGMAGTGGMSGTGGMGGTGGGGGNNVNPEADSGCGCAVPGTSHHEPLAALGALSALALMASRRRGNARMKA